MTTMGTEYLSEVAKSRFQDAFRIHCAVTIIRIDVRAIGNFSINKRRIIDQGSRVRQCTNDTIADIRIMISRQCFG